jgi:hypothetical protein
MARSNSEAEKQDYKAKGTIERRATSEVRKKCTRRQYL